MKIPLLALLLGTSALPAGTLILSDNFNAPDINNFDQSDQTGRRSGLRGPDVQLRSARIQLGIVGNQLNFLKPGGGSARIRFQEVASLPTNVWTDFAAGTTGTTILAEGGLRISFDWNPANTTSGDWISFNAGIADIATPEPAIRVNAPGTDFGVLFRNNGATQFFDNGAATVGTNFPVTAVATRKVVITLAFSSFDDGSTVVAKATVDGVSVLPDGYSFPWEDNFGIQNIELGNLAAGTRIDNLAISGLNGVALSLNAPPFYSSVANSGPVGTLATETNGAVEQATYTLVAGEGSLDNSKFKISGAALQSNGFNFQGLPDGSTLSVRIRAVGTPSGLSNTQIFQLTLVTDSDSDDLPDSYEIATANNLTDLKGRNPGPGPGAGTGNFDGDTLSDQQEFQLTRGLYPLLSPLLADTDGDGLKDGVELNPTAPRPVTNPTIADTDRDGLNDLVENNSGTFLSATNPGTSPLDYDSDDDAFPDGYEVTRSSGPLNNLSLPTLPAPLTTAILTTDETSGISSSKTYSHTISGGSEATVNGVTFTALKPAQPANEFGWVTTNAAGNPATFNEIAPFNLGAWLPDGGSLTGTGLLELLGGFTYSGSGDQPGSIQTYRLTGLTAGQKYELRLAVRVWSKGDSGRPISLTFANGSQSVNAYILQDRPGIMLGDGNADSAYALVFPYTALGTELAITAAVPRTTTPVSGSWHLYGLTNETIAQSGPVGSFAITSLGIRMTPSPAATLTFNSTPGAVYAVDYSTALNTTGLPDGWKSLTTTLPSGGTLTTYTDTIIVGSAPRIFYRIRLIRL